MSESKRTGPASRRNATTRVGYSVPHERTVRDDDTVDDNAVTTVRAPDSLIPPSERPARRSAPPASSIAPGPDGVPAIEVVVVEERAPRSARPTQWRAVEIWTKNRIYGLDNALTCFEVIDRQSGRTQNDHTFIGARLGGGQKREGDTFRLAHPLPVPGTEAVFKLASGKRGPFGQTTRVERVVIRLQVIDVSFNKAEPTWEEITGQFKRG